MSSCNYTKRICIIIFNIKFTFRTIYNRIFYPPTGQSLALFLGIAICAITAATFNSQQFSFWSSAFYSIGTSIIASGLIAKILESEDRRSKSARRAGLVFIGDRKSFEEYKMSLGRAGWDGWISETCRNGQIIIVGEKNLHWALDSWPTIKELVTQKSVQVTFVFVGNQKSIGENIHNFIATALSHDQSLNTYITRIKFYYFSESQGELPSTGFYWNGNELIVKLYFYGMKNEECPLIAFATPGVHPVFESNDFLLDKVIPLDDMKPLRQAAIALSKITKQMKEFDNIGEILKKASTC